MSRQSKMRRKAKAQVEARLNRPKKRLTKEQKELRRQQQSILIEARREERERKTRQALKVQRLREEREAALQKERMMRGRSRTSSPTSEASQTTSGATTHPASRDPATKAQVHAEGTALKLKGATVISRKSVHIKTYPAAAQVKFIGGNRAVVVQPDLPPVMLDLETGKETPIDATTSAPQPVTLSHLGA